MREIQHGQPTKRERALRQRLSLTDVVEAWDQLPEAVRAGILAMAKATAASKP